MDTPTKMIRQFLAQTDKEDLQVFLGHIYRIYESRDDYTGEIQRCNLALSDQLADLQFKKRDAIECSVNDLCAAYDLTAFTEGFQRGAAMILSLLCCAGGL